MKNVRCLILNMQNSVRVYGSKILKIGAQIEKVEPER